MKFLDMFSGIGGFRRGMELAGHECVGFCEIDKYAVASYTSMHLITDQQREYLATLPLKQRQKEILKEEYRNGEWYADDITRLHGGDLPRADIWCFGSPCQSFSQAGNREGLEGVSGLIGEIFRLIGELNEEDKPKWLISENVKGMLTSSKGFDFLRILLEMDRGGYDVQWQLLNSKHFGVPQNRERVFTVGCLRGHSTAKIFPLEGTDGTDCVGIRQVGRLDSDRNNPNQYRVYEANGIAPTLTDMQGGGREPHIVIDPKYRVLEGGVQDHNRGQHPRNTQRDTDRHPTTGKGLQGSLQSGHQLSDFFIDKNEHGKPRPVANTITAREDRGVSVQNMTGTAVGVVLDDRSIGNIRPQQT